MRKVSKRSFFRVALIALTIVVVLMACSSSIAAPGWPDPRMTMHIVVGYNPGGIVDGSCRTVQPFLEKYLGIPVIVQNIPGAGGIVASNSVQAGRRDGYTAMYTSTNDSIVAHKYLSPAGVPWELGDWKSTGIYTEMTTLGIIAHKNSGWKDFGDFIEAARSDPSKTYIVASMGPGRIDDITVIELQRAFGVKFNWVFYGGSADVQTDLMTGDLDVGVIGAARADFINHPEFIVLTGFAREWPDGSDFVGKIPNITDFEERLGFNVNDLSSLAVGSFHTLMVPANIPDEAFQALSAAMKQVANDPEFQEAIKAFSWPAYYTPEETEAKFAVLRESVEQMIDLHKQYVPR